MNLWPLSALLVWCTAWGAELLLRPRFGAAWALAGAALLGLALALLHRRPWRRVIAALGFPLAWALTGAASGRWALMHNHPGLWLLALLLLLALYPWRRWGDAPLYPTPQGALEDLPAAVSLPPGARVLDLGCGAGDGLRELCRVLPQAQIEGVEWSWLLVALSRWRAPQAQVRQGDLWAQSWQPYALLYVFQRPETMARVWAQACVQAPGAWLASLEFAVPEQKAGQSWAVAGGKTLYLYRLPVKAGTKPSY